VPSFVRVQISLLALSIVVPAACNALVLLGSVDPLVASNISGATLVVSWVGLVITPLVLGSGARTAVRLSALLVAWGFVSVWGPVVWDFTWFLLHRTVAGATAADRWLWYWWMYAVADTRFLRADPLMVVLECGSGLLGFAQAYALASFWNGKVRRAFYVSTLAGALGFYGTVVFFAVEALQGFRNITPDFFSFYVKWWGMNGLWLVMPIVAPFAYARLLREPGYDAATVLRREVFGMARSTRAVSSGPQTAA
jgi:hypothetical protein